MSGFDPDILKQASKAQAEAADPHYHVFVEANAGSGKTRVLVNRVVNILLGGTPPDQILCVTYTKAAAAEMKERLFDRLGRWSVADDESLKADLAGLDQTALTQADLTRARTLFARALETPGGLKIQTIHAFCENLLRRFPLEAGAPPGFKTLDDAQSRALAERARIEALDGLPRDTLDTLLDAGGAEAVQQIMQWATHNRTHLVETRTRAGSPEALCAEIKPALGLASDASLSSLMARFAAELPVDALRAAAERLQSGTKSDKACSDKILASLAAPDPASAYTTYRSIFFTDKGKLRDSITTKIGETYPEIDALFGSQKRAGYGREARRMEAIEQEVNILRIAEASQAALELAMAYLERYETALERQRALSFDDLIRLAGGLLDRGNPFSGWVGYKMDGQITHALIDEAQDTAPAQWDMLESLTEEFFAGAGARDTQRTLFIVGDEKQSIYSFQGAEPARFIEAGDRLAAQATMSEQRYARPELDVSFRSAREILSAVDEAFADFGADAPETKFQAPRLDRPFAHYHGHRAARTGTPGRVEFWPAIPKPEQVEEASIFDPVDQAARGNARDLLARTIAGEIRDMLDRGDAVWAETPEGFVQRPVTPRDIAILVWRRTGGFFEEVIRQLKLAQIPVAGADRMVLAEQTVVKDLLALARFAVSPADDLSLAELLKSPFFDPDDGQAPRIDDDALMALARTRKSKRPGTLWPALQAMDDARFAEARAALLQWRNSADRLGLYEAFAGFLNARTDSGETRWARLYARLGEEARDPAEEFLNRALDFQQNANGSMAGFLASIEQDEAALKREMTSDRDEVQVMTVHASKGLERPVIILPDTTRSPGSGRSTPIFAHETAGLLWSPDKSRDPASVEDLRSARELKNCAEHDRLLYVALTRARDRLIVCGWRQGNGPQGQIAEDSWYSRLSRQWQGAHWVDFISPITRFVPDAPAGLCFGPAPATLGPAHEATDRRITLPAWLNRPAPEDDALIGSARPSHLGAEGEVVDRVASPLTADPLYRFRRGDIIHKLLETLPELPQDRWEDMAQRYVSLQTGLDDAMRRRIVEETIGILNHTDFGPIFGPGSQAEISLSGRVEALGERQIRGQVDRLVITPIEVLIIDYKTNRPPPETVEGVAPLYLRQMAAYRALLRATHPTRAIRCALLWTDAARLMQLPDTLMDQALAAPVP